jgi:hypothetical protein
LLGGVAVFESHYRKAQGAVPNLRTVVQDTPVFGYVLGVVGYRILPKLNIAHRLFEVTGKVIVNNRLVLFVAGQRGNAATAAQFKRNALTELTFHEVGHQRRDIGMCVNVDESGRYHHSRDIHCFFSVPVIIRRNAAYQSVFDTDIGLVRRGSCAIHNKPIFEYQIDHNYHLSL